jgi:hypothetical protein
MRLNKPRHPLALPNSTANAVDVENLRLWNSRQYAF